MAACGVDLAELVKDLRRQVSALEEDLRARSEEVDEFAAALQSEYAQAYEAQRTAGTYGPWRDERVTQAAAAWVLATAFVRFCEDNGLIEWPFIAGPGDRLADADERHGAFFQQYPQLNDRDWLIAAFDHLASTSPTAAGLFDRRHNPLWELTPSFEAATALLTFWRRRGANGEIIYDFTDESWDTRFLGDLYQDLSESARKNYALLQTPEFVEEFILDLTLEPAVEEFGLAPVVAIRRADGSTENVAGLRTIDPACGSGHFLLGIFHRLLRKWRAAEPGVNDWELIRQSLESVHGCDKNPFAVSIARFRLLIAAMREAGEKRLDGAPSFPLNIAIGDSLLHGRGAPAVQLQTEIRDGELREPVPHTYRTEDVMEFMDACDLLGRSTYHVVVGNPPYITVKDKQENRNYRRGYTACAGTYALSVPFAQRLFRLAIRTHGRDRESGFVGQITANSFMKREFGKKLIENFFQTVDLSHVIDTSGAYIPGHGTPTVILIGRNRPQRKADPIRAVLGIRGEPSQPEDASLGLVWSAILEQVSQPDSESDWVSVENKERATFASHPWSLSGGGAAPVLASIEAVNSRLSSRIESPVGRAIRAGADEAFMRPLRSTLRTRANHGAIRPLMVGEFVRDWSATPETGIWYPYHSEIVKKELCDELWPWRALLSARRTFQGDMADADLQWWDYMQHTESAYWTPLSIVFAFVATHNHFVLDRGGKVFNRSAPVIKLPEGASEDDHLALVGVLNSSTACFWLKQVCQDKGNRGGERSTGRYAWESYFEFTGTKLQEFPLPAELPLALGRALDNLAQRLDGREPSAVCEAGVPDRARLDAARTEHEYVQGRMIALQEELDWQVYGLYGLLPETENGQLTIRDLDTVPEVKLGERAFEISLAGEASADEATAQWFARHGSTPATEIPAHWSEEYQRVVQARIDMIERSQNIALIERPECKRRWATEPWEKREKEALRSWLLDRCEKQELWFTLREGIKQPRTLTVNLLADQFRTDEDMHSVAALYAADHLGKRDLTLAQVLAEIVADEHVPYLAALRYKDTGLRKRAEWEQVWELQREEDRTGERLDIPVPQKYTTADFRKTSYWSHRGKLDVPKERFISYPGAGPDADPTMLLGWAGWDHKDQFQALVNMVNDRTQQAGWGTEKITPLLAGMLELLPWVHQWHAEYDADWGGNPAEEYQTYFDLQRTKHQLTVEDLQQWRPPAATRGRRAGAARRTTGGDDQQ